MRITDVIFKKFDEAHKLWLPLANEYYEQDVKTGTFKMNPGNTTFVWKEGVDMSAAEKKFETWGAEEIKVDRNKLSLADVMPAKLTPNEINAIQPLLTELEAVQ